MDSIIKIELIKLNSEFFYFSELHHKLLIVLIWFHEWVLRKVVSYLVPLVYTLVKTLKLSFNYWCHCLLGGLNNLLLLVSMHSRVLHLFTLLLPAVHLQLTNILNILQLTLNLLSLTFLFRRDFTLIHGRCVLIEIVRTLLSGKLIEFLFLNLLGSCCHF